MSSIIQIESVISVVKLYAFGLILLSGAKRLNAEDLNFNLELKLASAFRASVGGAASPFAARVDGGVPLKPEV